ncbi:zinc finger protein 808-like [Vanessa atalanta]|uniref:zinc finger protein 808-like n=1 Tax=Vanessa atalanta TaxID=42275 RepID=UPI001FCCC415|nr:zinc finger protein 808-like [Vanessa atalanta]
MDFTSICRTCFGKNELSPIFTNKVDSIDVDTLFAATGVKMEINDGLPQNMCKYCVKCLRSNLDFRKKCKDAEKVLLAIKRDNEYKIEVEIIVDNDDKKPKTLHITNDKSELVNENNQNILQNINNKLPNIDVFKEVEIKIENFESDNEDDIPLILLTDNSIAQNSQKNIEATDKKDISTELESVLYDYNDKSSRITCKLCQKNLSRRSFAMHMARHHPGADNTRIKCELCKDYILRDNLNRHLTSIHGTDNFKCRYCKKEFNSKELLVKHVTNCNVKKRRRTCESSRELTECDVCHKKMQKASLRMHKAVKHAGLGPVCEHCGKRFGNKLRLHEHYRAKHGYEKFKCNYCDFQSAGVMAMRNHERRHRGEKPFVCETCGAKFHAAYLLAQHRQSHRTEKQFKCEQCPASFKANNSLHMHRRACHSSARVACAVCARAYSCRHYAVKHMRAVHRYKGPVPQLNQT